MYLIQIYVIQGPNLPGSNLLGPNLPPRGPICRGPICRQWAQSAGAQFAGAQFAKKWQIGPQKVRGPICRQITREYQSSGTTEEAVLLIGGYTDDSSDHSEHTTKWIPVDGAAAGHLKSDMDHATVRPN